MLSTVVVFGDRERRSWGRRLACGLRLGLFLRRLMMRSDDLRLGFGLRWWRGRIDGAAVEVRRRRLEVL